MKRYCNGSAIITALLITAIAASIAALVAVRETIAIRQTQLTTNAQQAYFDAQGVVAWAEEMLINNLNNQIQNNAVETFPINLKLAAKFHGAEVTGIIEDANGLFNLNSLMNANQQQQFVRLLQAAVPNITANAAFTIANDITNWVRPSNADQVYLLAKPPYRASHILMADISELRLVNGVNQTLFLALSPYIVALPNTNDTINIMSAPIPVLMSLGNNITVEQAKALRACQVEAKTSKNIQQFFQQCMANLKIQIDPTINIIYSSNYFLVTAYVRLNNQLITLKTLLERTLITDDNQKTKIEIKLHWQSFY